MIPVSYGGPPEFARDPFSDAYNDHSLKPSIWHPNLSSKIGGAPNIRPSNFEPSGAHHKQSLGNTLVHPKEKISIGVETRKVYAYAPVGTVNSIRSLASMLQIDPDRVETYEVLLQSMVFSEHLLAYHDSATLDELKSWLLEKALADGTSDSIK